jgi:hypothetical protein
LKAGAFDNAGAEAKEGGVNTNKAQEYEIPADWDVTLDGAEKRGYAAGWLAGVEVMRKAAHPLMRWPEDHEGLDAVARRLLAEGEGGKPK